jgi:hypothetical protein
LELQVSIPKLVAQERFDVACTAAYFYFSSGLHIKLKQLQAADSIEIDISPCAGTIDDCWKVIMPGMNVSIHENLEIRVKSGNVPIKRTFLVGSIVLDAGLWQISCYAPIWNSTEWAYTSTLVPVSGKTNNIYEYRLD